jgi:hypothetical protein
MEQLEYKIYYNKNGWVCERYPYDIAITDEANCLEVDEDTFNKTLEAENHFAWRVVDGKLSHERYEPTPDDEIVKVLRERREDICFPIINRGFLWYESLTVKQKDELAKWYKAWLDATKTKQEPPIPRWLLSMEEANGTNTN